MGAARSRKQDDDGEWISLSSAAELLGEHRQTVLTRIVAGELEGKVVADRTIVTRASVERLRKQKEADAEPSPKVRR